MENTLVIGGAGFIGSNLIEKLKDERNGCIVVYEHPHADCSRLKDFYAKIIFVKGTLDDVDLLESTIRKYKIRWVIHLVSTLIPSSSFEDFNKELYNVVAPTARLANLCSRVGAKLIFFSSGGTVYGNRVANKLAESVTALPISYYGFTKQIIEENLVFEHRTNGLDYLIIRPSNPYGPGQGQTKAQGFIAVALGKVLSGNTIEVWGDGTNIRDYIFIKDLTEAVCLLLKNDVKNEIVNIGSGVGYSINEVISVISNTAGFSIDAKYVSRRSVDVRKMVLDVTKLVSLTGMKFTSLSVGVNAFYNYLKEQ